MRDATDYVNTYGKVCRSAREVRERIQRVQAPSDPNPNPIPSPSPSPSPSPNTNSNPSPNPNPN